MIRKSILFAAILALALFTPAFATTEGVRNNTIDLTPLLQALVGVLASILTAKVLPWIRAHTTMKQQAVMMDAIKTLVCGAEQVYGCGCGEKKLSFVQNKLGELGFEVDDTAIEAAVLEMKKGKAPAEKSEKE